VPTPVRDRWLYITFFYIAFYINKLVYMVLHKSLAGDICFTYLLSTFKYHYQLYELVWVH